MLAAGTLTFSSVVHSKWERGLIPNSPAQPPRPIACWPAEDLGSADTQHYRRTVGPLRPSETPKPLVD